MAVKYAILGLLHYEDMHGYRIKEHIEKNFGYMWTINYGQIYPTLKKLQEDGLLTMVEIAQTDAPARKLYSITDRGKEEFTRWLNSDPERQLIMRDPFLLRFAFFGFGEKDRALEIIDGRIRMYEEELRQRRENKVKWQRMSGYVRLLSDLGIELNEMMLAWLRKARAEIAAGSETLDFGMIGRESRAAAAISQS